MNGNRIRAVGTICDAVDSATTRTLSAVRERISSWTCPVLVVETSRASVSWVRAFAVDFATREPDVRVPPRSLRNHQPPRRGGNGRGLSAPRTRT